MRDLRDAVVCLQGRVVEELPTREPTQASLLAQAIGQMVQTHHYAAMQSWQKNSTSACALGLGSLRFLRYLQHT